MNSYYREIVWEGLEKKVSQQIERLKSLYGSGINNKSLPEVQRLCDPRHMQMLSQLPVERFARIRDELASGIMQVSIVVFNYFDKRWASTMVRNAWKLAVSEDMKTAIYNKHVEMTAIASNQSLRFLRYDFSFLRAWNGWLIIILIIIGFVVLFATVDGLRHSNAYRPASPGTPAGR
ncbi:MAG: hypothetical protein JST39_06360 [Bacteroidetes bacterium]|nr:hypothetical protein [Bacteroidota bacterium]